MSKTASTILIVIVCLICFPMVIGIIGGLFGVVFGVIGGLFGAVFGIIGGLLGAIFGFIGWFVEGIFGWGWDGPFHADWDVFTVILLVVIVALIARRSQRDSAPKR